MCENGDVRAMFRGIHTINMDAKGRIAMPTKYREPLVASDASQLIVTIDIQNPCLLLYPLSVWEQVEQTLQGLPMLNAAARRLQRLMLGHASEVDMDGSGRVLLPQVLREYANLSKKTVLVGQMTKFELWDEHGWQHETTQAIHDISSGELTIPHDIQALVL